MANGVYNRAKYLFATGNAAASMDLRGLLVSDVYTFNADHNTVSEVTANELTGYSRTALTTETVTEDDTNDFAYVDADDLVFTTVGAGQTVGGCIIYKFNAADASAELVAFYDVTNTATNGGDITIQWATVANGGVLKFA